MKQTILILTVFGGLLMACGPSQEEQRRISMEEQRKAWQEDSAALKIAVMPTLDCLPLYLAEAHGMFQRLGADIRLKPYTAQMDCDTALQRGRVEGMVSDLVRCERLQKQGLPIIYKVSTELHWQLLTNPMARIKQLKQLDDKMLAMTRFSATHMLSDLAVDSAKILPERVFRIQINDVFIRFGMLQTNTMDALLLPEPQATQARQMKAPVLLDSRKLRLRLGVVAFNEKLIADTARQHQVEVFIKAYNMACDTINANGIARYRDLLSKHMRLEGTLVDSLPADIRFQHASMPREQDLERVRGWLK